MKFLGLLFTCLLVLSCAGTIPITDNRDAAIAFINPAIGFGNGILIGVSKKNPDIYYMLTVAHMCNIDTTMGYIKDGFQANPRQAIGQLKVLAEMVKKKVFCKPTVIAPINKNCNPGVNGVSATVVAIDFQRDLMIMRVDLSKAKCKFKTAKISSAEKIEPGELLHASLVFPAPGGGEATVMLYGRAGLAIKQSCTINTKDAARSYVQVDLLLGPGTSGSGLYDKDNKLIGIMSCAMAGGPDTMLTRTSLIVPAKEINDFLLEVGKHDYSRVYCRGDEFLCEAIYGTAEVLGVFGTR